MFVLKTKTINYVHVETNATIVAVRLGLKKL